MSEQSEPQYAEGSEAGPSIFPVKVTMNVYAKSVEDARDKVEFILSMSMMPDSDTEHWMSDFRIGNY